jgi:hypothetical protein
VVKCIEPMLASQFFVVYLFLSFVWVLLNYMSLCNFTLDGAFMWLSVVILVNGGVHGNENECERFRNYLNMAY